MHFRGREQAETELGVVSYQVDSATLRARILRRNDEVGANAAFVSEEQLLRYQRGFEVPIDEGQTTIRH
ncbi:hypothetical protein [Nocardia sp. NPDC057272]|uniref:hypothetical protein n=1 Tax=Nocardia sp. NPDC057272 TaxID=3346079 RepID=UPI00362C9E4A